MVFDILIQPILQLLGGSEIKPKITGRGSFDWTDGAFSVAEKNNAYSYVTLPDGSKYSVEEFQGMFLMNLED